MDKLIFKKLDESAILPTRGSDGAAGLDLYAIGWDGESRFLVANDYGMIPLGIAVKIPEGHYGRIAPRSGLARQGVDVLAGVVDSDYRGELKVVLINHGTNDFKVSHGDRIAQLIIEKIETPEAVWGDLDETDRGADGFGSTGV